MNSSLTGLLGGSRDRGRLSPAGGSGELGSGGCSYHSSPERFLPEARKWALTRAHREKTLCRGTRTREAETRLLLRTGVC